ncbi:endonuclease III domain-containing protein [Syntrophorhabdus aromaticivorans]|uniref:endonuclease III domain-containing protein n=1 Tax=Syntrophorhabdus aromaticivorans TaxID=328301 RepID=UPI000422BD17|nr:endonuclease III domain-containing protein [Syntrophorhabdus aromaticivorans]
MLQRLSNIFNALLAAFGKRHWWPGETRLEVIVGAILTQNTSWKNVEKAIDNLKAMNLLDVGALHALSMEQLAKVIRPSGFYNVKSKRLKSFVKVLHDEFSGAISNLDVLGTAELRKLLLRIEGIGNETADSILLYALNRPIFVVDAYTKRFLVNHGLYTGDGTYDDVQSFFMEHLPPDTYLFNEFHALIVCLCQNYCRKVPACAACPLREDLNGHKNGLSGIENYLDRFSS